MLCNDYVTTCPTCIGLFFGFCSWAPVIGAHPAALKKAHRFYAVGLCLSYIFYQQMLGAPATMPQNQFTDLHHPWQKTFRLEWLF